MWIDVHKFPDDLSYDDSPDMFSDSLDFRMRHCWISFMPTLRSGPKHEATLELQHFKNSKQLQLVGKFNGMLLLFVKSRITRLESGTHETSKNNSCSLYL